VKGLNNCRVVRTVPIAVAALGIVGGLVLCLYRASPGLHGDHVTFKGHFSPQRVESMGEDGSQERLRVLRKLEQRYAKEILPRHQALREQCALYQGMIKDMGNIDSQAQDADPPSRENSLVKDLLSSHPGGLGQLFDSFLSPARSEHMGIDMGPGTKANRGE